MFKNYLKIIFAYIKGCYFSFFYSEHIVLEKGKKYAFVMLAADYNNLGDLAITRAQYEFLRKHLSSEYQVLIIYHKDTYKYYRSIKKQIDKYSIITLIGGGNNGSLYDFIEAPRRFILRKFRKYRIISFPQTVVFNEERKMLPYKKVFVMLCNKCVDLTVVAREKDSYNIYKSLLDKSVEVLLSPDIVFSYEIPLKKPVRENFVAFILRNDKEKLLSINTQNEIIDYIKIKFNDYVFIDTCDINAKHGIDTVIEEYLEILQHCKLAVTDRLHGMILCYITRTPCMVFPINNYKIESTFKSWLVGQNFIKFNKKSINNCNLTDLFYELENIDTIKCSNLFNEFNNLVNALTVKKFTEKGRL